MMSQVVKDKRFIFVSFALAEGKMFKLGSDDTCMVVDLKRKWGCNYVFGILIHTQSPFDIRVLDGMYGCSKTTLYKNHRLDLNHRLTIKVNPIEFNNLKDFSDLKYVVSENQLTAQVYVVNTESKQHVKISKSLYRVIDGVNKQSFVKTVKLLASNNKLTAIMAKGETI